MAEIKSAHTTFRLIPLALESSSEEWIISDVSLRIDNNRQSVLWRPIPHPTIRRNEYRKLVIGIRRFVERLAATGSDNLFEEVEPFFFVPLELDFEFECLDGELSPNGDGEITLRVMINTNSRKPEYVGSTVSISATQLQHFLNDLEEETAAIFQQIEAALA